MSNEDVACYIAKCLCGCGNIIFVSVDEPKYRKDNAKDISKLIRDGYKVESTTVGVARTLHLGCASKRASASIRETK